MIENGFQGKEGQVIPEMSDDYINGVSDRYIELFEKITGSNFIKVGIGSGAACRTRSEVGVGIPQLSAIMDCYDDAQRIGVDIISDGGCVTTGDICKAIGAGAKMVMIAGMVSKSEECDNIVEIDGKKYVNLYGLGSTKQYNKHGNHSKKD